MPTWVSSNAGMMTETADGSATGDQKRIMTPARAIAAGADYLVVGRPVVEADDPRAVAQAILTEITPPLAA